MSVGNWSPSVQKDEATIAFVTSLNSFGISTEEELNKILPHVKLIPFAKHQHLYQAGDIASHVYFICKGLVRFYYTTEDGKEVNKSFGSEGKFVGALQSSHHPQPCRYHIQALEDTTTLSVPIKLLHQLYITSLPWATLGRVYMENLAVKKQQREAQFLLDNAEQRYLDFINENKALAERLPQYHIASYLGITDVALSRVRGKLKRNVK